MTSQQMRPAGDPPQPPGAVPSLAYASLGRRALAWASTRLLEAAPVQLARPSAFRCAVTIEHDVIRFAPILDPFYILLILIPTSILGFVYNTFFEMAGITLGKLAVGIRVMDEDGHAPGLARSLVRNLLRLIDFLPLFYLVGYCIASGSPTRQRLGDRVAHTYVVSRRDESHRGHEPGR